mmetsp:Transcript_662/g.2703  ORF Transcript_662/g.2703 Transcript_662/m.2703 type:complete len:271 (+) Transcript_662:81-893(+)
MVQSHRTRPRAAHEATPHEPTRSSPRLHDVPSAVLHPAHVRPRVVDRHLPARLHHLLHRLPHVLRHLRRAPRHVHRRAGAKHAPHPHRVRRDPVLHVVLRVSVPGERRHEPALQRANLEAGRRRPVGLFVVRERSQLRVTDERDRIGRERLPLLPVQKIARLAPAPEKHERRRDPRPGVARAVDPVLHQRSQRRHARSRAHQHERRVVPRRRVPDGAVHEPARQLARTGRRPGDGVRAQPASRTAVVGPPSHRGDGEVDGVRRRRRRRSD